MTKIPGVFKNTFYWMPSTELMLFGEYIRGMQIFMEKYKRILIYFQAFQNQTIRVNIFQLLDIISFRCDVCVSWIVFICCSNWIYVMSTSTQVLFCKIPTVYPQFSILNSPSDLKTGWKGMQYEIHSGSAR